MPGGCPGGGPVSIDITLDTLPAYLRGEGWPEQADQIEAAGHDAAQLLVELADASRVIPSGTEAHLAVSQMFRVIGRAGQ